MFLSEFFSLLAKIFLFTGRIETKNAFDKPLSQNEEKEYFLKMKNGDKNAEEVLIKHNLRLVAHIAKKYKNSSIDNDDLISIGSIGLMKAIKTFTYEKGNSFSTYASRCIENEILMTFRSDKKNASSVYLDEVISVDKDGNNLSLYEILKDNSPSVDITIENKIMFKKVSEIILNKLNEREREIITKRYGLFGETPKTQIELAKELKISRSYISRLEKKAIKTIKSSYNFNWFVNILHFYIFCIILIINYDYTEKLTTPLTLDTMW